MKINFLVLFLFCLLVSCSFGFEGNYVYASQENQDRPIDLSNITYINSETKRDLELETAISKVFGLKHGEDRVRYYYNRIDLNSDGIPETFVYLSGPTVCGTGGCSAIIFRRTDNQYKLVSRFSLVRTPMIIREKMTNGWKNIVMYVSGGGMEGRYKELIFDGVAYPSNPSIQPDAKNGKIRGVGIISDDLSINKGINF